MKTYNIPKNVKGIIFDIDGTLYTNVKYVFEQVDVQVRYYARLKNISVEEARNKVAAYKKQWAENHNGEKIIIFLSSVCFWCFKTFDIIER